MLNGTVTARNGYTSAVSLSCGAGAPPTCIVTPATVTPTVAGVPFTVRLQDAVAQTDNFSINGAGTDAAHLVHLANAAFSSLFTVRIPDSIGTQTVAAGQTAAFALT
jgi:hypothetical protein